MQTLQTNHMPSTMTTTTFSNNSGHRRMGSGELDVFEASRYFSGDIDGLPLGFGAWSYSSTAKKNDNINKKKSLELIPSQQHQQALAIDHHDKQNKLEKKRAASCKPLNSPTAKLASYLNSFLLQRSSRKKSINSKSKHMTSMQSLKKNDDDHLHHHESMSFRSYSDCSKSYSSFDRRINGEYDNYHQGRMKSSYYKRREVGDEVEVEDDGDQSDSSSDLFELRNMEAIGDHGPNDLHVYGTTSFEVAIATAILL